MEIYRDNDIDIYMYTLTHIISLQLFGSAIIFQNRLRVVVGLLLWEEDEITKTVTSHCMLLFLLPFVSWHHW